MIKIWYTGFIEHDVSLYNVEAGKSLDVQNLSMHEEMGQIQYLFCDKTGTLTKNQLIFREMAVLESDQDQSNTQVQHITMTTTTMGSALGPFLSKKAAWKFKKLPPSQSLENTLRCILLCHDVLRINGKLSGSSQDELVLMEMIEQNYEATYITRDSDSITIRINGQNEVYKLIKNYEFTSDRKMMSITVRRASDNVVMNFAKGADTVIRARLAVNGERETALFNELESYAALGLRTLTFAMRLLEEDMASPECDENKIESEYSLLGITGVEDLLQDNVQ